MVAQAAAASLGQARNRVVWPLKYSQLSVTAWLALHNLTDSRAV